MGYINNIRKKREERGFSQDYMADSLGITVKTYARIENGQGRLLVKLLDDLSRILESNPYELIHFENYDHNHINGNGSETEDLKKQYRAILRLHEEKARHLEAEVIYLRHLLEKKMIPIK
jgi:transcriptional regulator with XRE-family HTH domain